MGKKERGVGGGRKREEWGRENKTNKIFVLKKKKKRKVFPSVASSSSDSFRKLRCRAFKAIAKMVNRVNKK